MQKINRARREQIKQNYLSGKTSYDASMNALRFEGMSEVQADELLHPPKKFEMDGSARCVGGKAEMAVAPSKEVYPLPGNAAYVWTVGDNLFLGLPSETGQPHTVIIPLDRMVPDCGPTGLPKHYHRGFAVLLDVLQQRERASRNPTIGARGAPPKATVQAAIESDAKYAVWIQALGQRREKNLAEKAEAEAFLKELGL